MRQDRSAAEILEHLFLAQQKDLDRLIQLIPIRRLHRFNEAAQLTRYRPYPRRVGTECHRIETMCGNGTYSGDSACYSFYLLFIQGIEFRYLLAWSMFP